MNHGLVLTDFSIKKILSLTPQNDVAAGYDVAVLELEKPMSAEQAANRVCWPLKPISHHVGKMATIAGWGRLLNDSYPQLLQRLEMKVLPDCMGIPAEIEINKYTFSLMVHFKENII